MPTKLWTIRPNLEARIDVKLETKRNEVINFSVVLIWLHGKEAETVILYDAAHGEIDCHRCWKSQDVKETERFKGRSKKEVFTEVYRDVKKNWEKYLKLYKEHKKPG